MTYWFTSDEHYYHRNILKYTSRPFKGVDEMNKTLINNHNSVVGKQDITVHAGDFTLLKDKNIIFNDIVYKLNGYHIFLEGSHDYWISKGSTNYNQIWEKNIYVDGKKYYFVVCHYAMRTWARSHYGSYMLYGHSHGTLPPEGKQHDVGVDNNGFYPVSDKQIVEIMKSRPDNFNLVRK